MYRIKSSRPAARTSAFSGAVSLLSRIGNTPLLDLSDLAQGQGVNPAVKLYAKAEWFNPGGSVKARPALRMVTDAEKRGELTPDKILIDSSSGNTGIAFALIGAAKGYRVQLVMPANVSVERKALVRAYGAELIESDPLEGADGAIRQVRAMTAAQPERFYYANQYNNPSNWQAHYATTGPEIWRQTGGRVTHFVAGMGTTGTFTGVGRFLKARASGVQLVGVQPEDELAVIEGLKHLETAIVPEIFDPALPDRFVRVGPDDAWQTARRLGPQAGLFIGLSAGAAVHAAIAVARELDQGVVVTVLPDDGSKYVSLGVFDR
ncbi:MAG: cysteine synthase family protein [Caldilineaceae bacterium]|nr:cysteine synthase family protein [Caldilineaceae bacterium]